MIVKNFKNIDEATADKTEIETVAYITIGQTKIFIEKKDSGYSVGIQGKPARQMPATERMTIGIAANAATMTGY